MDAPQADLNGAQACIEQADLLTHPYLHMARGASRAAVSAGLRSRPERPSQITIRSISVTVTSSGVRS